MFPESPTHGAGLRRARHPSLVRSPASRSLAVVAAVSLAMVGACTGSDAAASGPPQVEGDAIGVAGAHEHGVVRLGLAVDGTEVTLAGEAPADALFGFERAPETDEERALVAERLQLLRGDAGSLVSFPESNRCYVDAISVNAPDAFPADAAGSHDHGDQADHEHDEAGHDHGEDDHDHEAGEHLEIELTIRWSCGISPEGYPATLQLSRLIPEAELVDLTVVTSRGSGAARVGTEADFRF